MDKKAEILDRAARMAIIRSGVEKNANIFSKMKDFATTPINAKRLSNPESKSGWTPMKLLGVVAAGVITNQFVKKLIDAGERAGIKMKSPHYYQKMIEENPQIMELDQEQVLRLWKTLYQTAPHLAEDPVAAGGFIVQNISAGYLDEFGAPPMDSYKTLVGLEKDIQNNRDSGAANAFGSLVGALSAGAIS